METETEVKNIVEKDFEAGGKVYRYCFDSLTVEQAELAREIGEFKYNQLQHPPDNFKQVVKSRSTDWLTIMASYFLREVKNGVVQPFTREKAETNVEKFVGALPVSQLEGLKECVQDFFTNMGRPSIASVILQNEQKLSGAEMLLTLLQSNLSGSRGSEES
jgi:hypothetical protein